MPTGIGSKGQNRDACRAGPIRHHPRTGEGGTAMDAATLDAEIAALRQAATEHAARHETIPALRWPDGVRMAVNFTLDFDAMLLRRLMNEPPMQLAKGEFGGRVGIWRAIEL